jgi:hypothetical protein
MTASGFEKLMRAAGKAAGRVRRDFAADATQQSEVTVTLDAEELASLDAWIAARPDPKPSRPEAIALLLREMLMHR